MFSERFFYALSHLVVGTCEHVLTEQTYIVEMDYMVCSLLTRTSRFNIESDNKRAAIPFLYRQQPGERNETGNDDIVLSEP